MALPKEPRQKMINMMYLVLTALLALNVSAEIINAFKVVDNSLVESNRVLSTSTSNVYTTLSDMLKDPKTAEKAAIWQPKAMAAKQIADQTYGLLEKYKDQLKRESTQRVKARTCTLPWRISRKVYSPIRKFPRPSVLKFP
jgi:methionine-rich copper-binding protein CopC